LKDQQSQTDPTENLHTYLHDHTAGAEHAVELFKALQQEHEGTLLGQFAAAQLREIQQDLTVLESLAKRAGADGFQVKELAGWIGDKLSRLKLAPSAGGFHTFEALEFLSLGILGKRSLWRALHSVSSMHPELQGVNYMELIQRAEAQYEATEKMRLQMAVQVFD
jgi:hypothetical protein